jgi:hypothetical protein
VTHSVACKGSKRSARKNKNKIKTRKSGKKVENAKERKSDQSKY